MLCRSYGTLFVLSEFYYKRFVPTELTFLNFKKIKLLNENS